MSFLDKLKKSAETATQTAAVLANNAVKQTKTMASVGRVKLAIASEEDKLKKAYTELGRLFYRDYEAQAEADMEEYLPWCQKAKDCREQIQLLTEELERLKTDDASEAQPVDVAAAEEEQAIFADLEEAEETPAPDVEEPAAEEPVVSEKPKVEDPAEEVPAAPVIELAEEPAVGTLYVDISGEE